MLSSMSAIRNAVRKPLENLEAGDLILVAVSGGADSLALAYALSMEAPLLAITVRAVTVDHQLQTDSALQAVQVKAQMKALGIETSIENVTVEITEGLEASARKARYAALDTVGNALNAAAIFLGHTRDDQAETVLLGLARGSGTRSLSGMAEKKGKYIRPLLTITRAQTEKLCEEVGLLAWKDPHNKDSNFARVRVRTDAIPILEKTIGPGISEALARSADLLRHDADALDAWVEREILQLNLQDMDCEYLSQLPHAIRSRIIRRAIYSAGAPSGSLSADHVGAVEALITAWNGQKAAHLPGGVKVRRFSGRLSLLRY